MKTLRYFIRLILAFLFRFKVILLIGIVLGIATFFAMNMIIPYVLASKKEVVGVTGRYHIDQLPSNITQFVSRGLTKTNSDSEALPDLAKNWETRDAGKVWEFTLRDVFWQDGQKLTSHDISYDFTDVDLKRPDDKTLVFELENPFAPFPHAVSDPIFKSGQGLLGVGDWKVKNVSLAGGFVQELELVKSDEERYRKIFKFYPNEDRTKIAFKLGSVDRIENLTSIKPFDTWQTVDVHKKLNKNQVVTLFFNNAIDPFGNNKTLRQALSYSLKKTDLGAERAVSPISPDSWAYNPQVKTYDYDLQRAKELLEDMPQEAIEKIDIKLATSANLLPTGEKIVKDWNDLGIKASVQVVSYIPDDFQAFLTILDIPSDPDQYALWHSTQETSNISNYSNARIDKLLEEGRSVLEKEERKKIYLDFQRFLLEEVPAIFLYHPVYYDIERK